jgi:hypothetical protein
VNTLDAFIFGLTLTRKRQPVVLQPVMCSSFCDKLGTGSVVSVASLSLLFYPNFIDAEKHSEYNASPTILSLLYIPYTFPSPLPHLSSSSAPTHYSSLDNSPTRAAFGLLRLSSDNDPAFEPWLQPCFARYLLLCFLSSLARHGQHSISMINSPSVPANFIGVDCFIFSRFLG